MGHLQLSEHGTGTSRCADAKSTVLSRPQDGHGVVYVAKSWPFKLPHYEQRASTMEHDGAQADVVLDTVPTQDPLKGFVRARRSEHELLGPLGRWVRGPEVDDLENTLGGRQAAAVHRLGWFRRVLGYREKVQPDCSRKVSEDYKTNYWTAPDDSARVQFNGAACPLSRKLHQKPREAEVPKWKRKYSVAYNFPVGVRMQSSFAMASAGQPMLRNATRSHGSISALFPIPCCRFSRTCAQSSSRLAIERRRKLVPRCRVMGRQGVGSLAELEARARGAILRVLTG